MFFWDPDLGPFDPSLLPHYCYMENGEVKVDQEKFDAHQANQKKTRRFYMSARRKFLRN